MTMACGPGCFAVRLLMMMTHGGLLVTSEGSLQADVTLMVMVPQSGFP